MDDSIYLPVFITLHPNLEAFHAFANRLRAELLSIGQVAPDKYKHEEKWKYLQIQTQNIATGETSQAITPFHFFDNLNFHH